MEEQTKVGIGPTRLKLAYVAGPYRAATEYQLVQNIRTAESLALELWKAGFAVLCPHKNTAHWGGACPDAVWLDGDIEMLSRCDLVVTTKNWQKSEGARAEVMFASANGIPVTHGIAEAQSWLRMQGGA